MEYLAVHSLGSLQAVNTGRSVAQDDRTCCSVVMVFSFCRGKISFPSPVAGDSGEV